jgi:hypothetical protein
VYLGPCARCGAPVPASGRYCVQCGTPYSGPPVPLGSPDGGWRLQVDSLASAPRRDIRYSLIVLGVSLLVVGLLFVSIAAVVEGALSLGGAGCGRPACAASDPSTWVLLLGLPFLGLGAALLVLGLWWTFRAPGPPDGPARPPPAGPW